MNMFEYLNEVIWKNSVASKNWPMLNIRVDGDNNKD